MTIHTLPLGFLQANCYIVAEHDRCIAIDPGGEAEKVLALLKKEGLTLDGIFLTHGHFDHVGAVEDLAKAAGCPVYLHAGDNMGDVTMGQFFPLLSVQLPDLRYWEDGDVIFAGNLCISVLETPGHTQGSVCLAIGNDLFTGDTLFQNSIGRTDLPGGDMAAMRQSLGILKNLDKNYTVYPGHGPKTTLDREKRVNPYMR